MTLDTSHAALAQRYAEIPYAAIPHAQTHPDRLATVATFFGMHPPPVATCRVLEIGCSEGANLVPMALGLPHAQFVGVDLSPPAIAAARALTAALGLANVALLEGDIDVLAPSLGTFDYIVAHGVYSWVPPPVRDAILALARDGLSPQGVMFVSYNVLPGARVRQAAWEVLHHATDGIADPRERMDAARRLARIVADGAPSLQEGDEALRTEFRGLAQRADSALFHDDLAMPNDPVYFHEFASHAARFGLAYLAEADVHTMSAAGLSADARAFVGPFDALAREQYLDFVRLRRFRQSLVRRHDATIDAAPPATRLASMQVGADPSLLRAAEAGKVGDFARGLDPAGGGGGPVRALLDALVASAPSVRSMSEVQALVAGGPLPRPLPALVTDLYVSNLVQLHVSPPAFAAVAGERPRASPLARVQTSTQEEVTNLLHARTRIADPNARKLLGLLDGTRDRAALGRALVDPSRGLDAAHALLFVDHALAQFARLALLAA